MEFKKVAVALALSAGLASSGLQAADNPTGPTANSSTGNFDIVLRNDVQVKLFGLDDVTFDTDSGTTGDLSGSTPSCVDSNVERYEVSLVSSNDFKLIAGSGPASGDIPYLLTYSQNLATDQIWGDSNLSSGDAAGDFARDGTIGGDTCSVALDSKITVDILESDYTGKDVGVYSDTVTVVVSAI
ncbi:hypothetical protein [Endozoicomonas sp. 8E]|uniref:hypothetical protein n=1 Tax=Endozoicomonas sp. 8E TaxID=3035692 RepID=UPI0029394EB5|nr:hypothetical protein [Endozoicomonas sp. 8E]WOG28932.1 hypothetical protein P6910_04510 [Endozoicomonas sp. 8E]